MKATPPTDQAIYERMVSAILDHQLPPGTKLVEDRLAAAFGVSRTRIRPVLAVSYTHLTLPTSDLV